MDRMENEGVNVLLISKGNELSASDYREVSLCLIPVDSRHIPKLP